jgi:titin
VPLSPSSITGAGTGGSTTIEWIVPTSDGGSPITDYVIEYSVAGSGTWTTFNDGTSTATSATITGLTAGNAYEFRVSAKNLIGNSLPSFSSPVIETLATAPSISSVTGASEKVTVAWNAPTHLGSGTLTDYEVTAYDAAGNVAGSCNPASGQRTCEITGLDNGASYTFKVAAITSVGSSAESSASSVVVPAGVPSAPANVVAVTSGSNMTVTFEAPADNGGSAITSYLVTSSPAGATCTVGVNATTYTCTGLTAGTNYTYTVKAVNSKGESSASLASTSTTAVAAPSAPLNVSAVITAGSTTLSATVSFDPPANENGSPVTSYTVTASPGGATCTVTAPTTYCDIPVLPDSLYTFTATATNAVGTSSASTTSLQTAAANGIAPTLVVDPIPAPTGDLVENKVVSSNITLDRKSVV